MNPKIVIIGNGVVGQVLVSYLRNTELKSESNILIVPVSREGAFYKILDVDIEKVLEIQKRELTSHTYLGIGYWQNNRAREELALQLKERGVLLDTFISDRALVSAESKIENNILVMPGATLEPFSSVKEGSIIWSGAHVSHHAEIGTFCFVSSSAVISGSAIIGNRTFVGSNATIFDKIQVGPDSIIGAGSIVRHDCDPQSIVASPSSVVTIFADAPSI